MNFSSETIEEADELDINLTPLIDIVFLLLIFFMVSTTFVENDSIKVNLPKASKTPSTQTKSESITLTIDKDGNIFHGQEQVSIYKLESVLQDKKSLVVRADESSRHGKVVTVLDLARKNGISKIAIATKEK